MINNKNCDGNHIKLCLLQNCNKCFNKSFASHSKASCWNIEKNIILPRNVSKNSHKNYWFICDLCNHDIKPILKNINLNNSWCSICSHKELCENIDCDYCFTNSFASDPKAYCWNIEKNNFILPRDIFKNSHNKFWFTCDSCKHEFDISPNAITNSGNWCIYCAHQKLCENIDCEYCFTKSFASHSKASYWNVEKNNFILPRDVFKNNTKIYWFTCDSCKHEFKMQLSSITSMNCWCTHCKNKTEKILYNFLLLHYPTIEHGYSVDWCKNKRNLPFDFVIKSIKIIIELDGAQHINIQIPNWNSPEENRKNDIFKMKCANKNGYTVIRVLQHDVFNNTYNWKTKLLSVIKKYEETTNIFLCKNNEYNEHLNLMCKNIKVI